MERNGTDLRSNRFPLNKARQSLKHPFLIMENMQPFISQCNLNIDICFRTKAWDSLCQCQCTRPVAWQLCPAALNFVPWVESSRSWKTAAAFPRSRNTWYVPWSRVYSNRGEICRGSVPDPDTVKEKVPFLTTSVTFKDCWRRIRIRSILALLAKDPDTTNAASPASVSL